MTDSRGIGAREYKTGAAAYHRRVHVGFSLLTLLPGRIGGSEANVQGLLAEFAGGNGPERVTVLANQPVMEAYRDRVSPPVALHRVPAYRQGDGDVTRLAAMTAAALLPGRIARQVPAEIDVLHHPVTVPIPRLSGVPTVTTVYDLQHREMPGLFSRAERVYRRWAYEGAARKADLVLTTSEYSRSRLVEIAGVAPARVFSVPMGIDHGRFREADDADDEQVKRELGLPGRYLVYPANLWPHKNHDRLVDALSGVGDGDLHLVLTGQDYGRRGALMERARRAGVADRVHHLGYVPRATVPALYRMATAMVFPSLYEGFGSPPLEAMACGCPVASTTSGSLGEMLGEAALTFDPTSVEAIADAIRRVVDDDRLRADLRRNGLARAAMFTWQKAARRHVELYARALEGGA
jgi:glycosyltransferase involved in cell wall biosynthesis